MNNRNFETSSFITHNLEEDFLLADRILILYDGKVQQFETPEEIFYHPENLNVAELMGISNIFDDAYVEEYNEGSKSAVFKSGDMRIRIKSPDFKVGDKISWGIHPENIPYFHQTSALKIMRIIFTLRT